MSLSKNNTNKTNQHLATKAKEGGKKTVKIATCNKYHKLDTSQKKKKKTHTYIQKAEKILIIVTFVNCETDQ